MKNYWMEQYLLNFCPTTMLADCNVLNGRKLIESYNYNVENREILLLPIQNWVLLACIMIHLMNIVESLYFCEFKNQTYALLMGFFGVGMAVSIVCATVFLVAFLYLSFVKIRVG